MTVLQPTQTIWVTRDGKRIPVRKMTDSHLINTIRYLRRWAAAARPQLAMEADAFAATSNGEMASYFASQDASRLYDMDDDEFISIQIPTWDRLLDEAEKRKLL